MAGIGEALGSRHPWARARQLEGDPAMQLLGQEPLRRGRATGGWQDSCAVHDSRALDGENAPWRQDVRAVRSPTVLCGAFRMHSTHILPKLGVFEYMQAIYCHDPVFSRPRPLRERMRRKTATDRRPGPHHGDILPGPAERERIGPISCRCRTLGNAFREHFATGERPGLHRGIILPRPNACRTPRAPRPTAPNALRLSLGSSSSTTPCAAAPSRHATHAALSPPLKK